MIRNEELLSGKSFNEMPAQLRANAKLDGWPKGKKRGKRKPKKW
jgi:hypothetical protein